MNLSQTLTKSFVAMVLAMLVFSTLPAVSTWVSAAPPEGADADQDRMIRRWVRQLDSDQFAQRQEAAEKLTELGKDAVPAIEQAALTGTGEVASRSVDILKGLAASPDEATAQLARSSLDRLAASGNQTASYLAERARMHLREQVGPGHRGAGNPFRGDMAMPQRANRTVRISTVNGDRTVDVTEDGERVVAKTMADGSVSVTWHLPGGKQRTVEADNAEKLQEQNPEAFAKLEELTQMAEAGPARFPGRQFPGGHFPLPRVAPQDDFDPFAQLDAQMREMRARHEQILAEMEAMLDEPRFPRPEGPPAARLRRIEPPRFPLPAGVRPEEPAAEAQQKLPAIKHHLEQLLNRLEKEEDLDIDPLELERLERAIQEIEKQLDAK